MQKFLIIIISCLLVSCSPFKGEQGKIYDKLQAWDKVLYEKPRAIMDSLKTINHQELSDKNKAYYSLLITIARNKLGFTEKDDSTISVAVDWYKGGKDYKNICRSLLYRGIVIDEINIRDSLLYNDLLEAKRIFYKFSIYDNDFESQIYTLLGRTYITNRIFSSDGINFDTAFEIPKEYFIKSLGINRRLNNQRELQKIELEINKIGSLNKKRIEALAILNSLGNPDLLSLPTKFELYKANYSYYLNTSERNFKQTIQYLQMIIEIVKNTNNFKNSTTYYYGFPGNNNYKFSNKDSYLLYSKLALKTTDESHEKSAYENFKYLADAFALSGDYKSAYESSQKIIPSYLTVTSEIETKALKSARDDLSKMKHLMTKEKRIIYILGISLIVLVTCFSIGIFWSRKKSRLALKELTNNQSQIAILDEELQKIKFINQLRETSLGALPKLVDDVNKHASRSRKFSSELSDDLNDSINSIRSLSKENLSSIVHTKPFLSANPNVKYLTSLSDTEIVVLILFDLKFGSKEISEILNNSQSSVRAMKTRIKGKILAIENLPFDPEKTFYIFSKDHNHRD